MTPLEASKTTFGDTVPQLFSPVGWTGESHWNDYHAVLRSTDGTDPVEAAIDQLGCWLREKNIDVDLRHDNEVVNSTQEFRIRYHERDQGHNVRAILIEDSSQGQWRSSITVSTDGWAEVLVRSAEGRFVAVPRIARYLMQAIPLGDAGLDFVDHAEVWDADRLDELRTLLTSPDRQAPVFVAAIDASADLDREFTKRVGIWVKQTYGLAKTIVLTPRASARVAQDLGSHAPWPWTLRTYLPNVQLGDTRNALRHRYLTTESLANRPDSEIIKLLGGIARNLAFERPRPTELTRLHRVFRRLEDQQLTEAIRSERNRTLSTLSDRKVSDVPSAVHTEAHPQSIASGDPQLIEQLQLVREVFGLDTITLEALQEIAEAATAPRVNAKALSATERRLESLRNLLGQREDTIADLRIMLQDHEIDTAVANGEASDARNENTWLRKRLSELNDFDNAWTPAPSNAAPADFGQLIKQLPAGVVFMADMKDAEAVMARDSLGNCLRNAWDAVLAMGDYLRAKAEGLVQSSFHDYLLDTPAGFRGLAPSKSAENESGSTKQQYGHERLLPVPKNVDPSGRVQMKAHIRLGKIGMASPRLYYHHDTASACIFIGYLGLHMTNTKTN